MNKLDKKTRQFILKSLVEGQSIRAISRIFGVSKNTVAKMLKDAGRVCAEYQYKKFVDLPCTMIECDEIWSFCYAKKKVPKAKSAPPEAGDVWTWVAVCPHTKLVPSWLVADRSTHSAILFMKDLELRMANRVQLTTDGHRSYLEAVEKAFGSGVDYAMLVKQFGSGNADECTGFEKSIIKGDTDIDLVSTSYVERQNLTMRMAMRRFTRKTNGFSKKIENHAHSVALHFMYYNFIRIYQTLRCTPAMEAGIADRFWEIDDLLELIDSNAPKPNRPKTYRKRK